MIKIDEKVSSMYGQRYEEKPSQVQEECDPEVCGENVEKKLQSIINSIGDQSALFLMAVGDCIVNKKSQAEVATKYNIPGSRIQRAMSGKKEHRKGGKQYQQEKKRKPSEEDSTRSLKIRRNERELERIDDKSTLDIEGQNSKEDRDEQPDAQLWGTSYNNFQSFSGPPHPPIGNILEKANNTKLKGELTTRPSSWSNII